jgi:hypothetical protein
MTDFKETIEFKKLAELIAPEQVSYTIIALQN